jgi:hypothetical protein
MCRRGVTRSEEVRLSVLIQGAGPLRFSDTGLRLRANARMSNGVVPGWTWWGVGRATHCRRTDCKAWIPPEEELLFGPRGSASAESRTRRVTLNGNAAGAQLCQGVVERVEAPVCGPCRL